MRLIYFSPKLQLIFSIQQAGAGTIQPRSTAINVYQTDLIFQFSAILIQAHRIKDLLYPVKKRQRNTCKLNFWIPTADKQENEANECIFKFFNVFQLKLLCQCKIIINYLIIF